MVLSKNYHNSDGKRSHRNVLIGSKQKHKNENRDTIGSLKHLKVMFTQARESYFSMFGSWSLILYLRVWVNSKFFLITVTWQS